MTLRDQYNELVGLVSEKGEHFRKPHGEWVRLRLDDDPNGLYLQLDTWSKAMGLKRGPGDYHLYGGFDSLGGFVEYLGIDFGGFELRVSPRRLATYLRLVRGLP
jgi:hypothetical protein